jgi:hypothetical protein
VRPASLSQDVGLALGAQAGEARIRDVVISPGMEYLTSTPETIAASIAEEIAKPVTYPTIDPQAASRVAARIAEML